MEKELKVLTEEQIESLPHILSLIDKLSHFSAHDVFYTGGCERSEFVELAEELFSSISECNLPKIEYHSSIKYIEYGVEDALPSDDDFEMAEDQADYETRYPSVNGCANAFDLWMLEKNPISKLEDVLFYFNLGNSNWRLKIEAEYTCEVDE